MKTKKTFLMSCMLGASLLLGACSSEQENLPKSDFGTVSFGVEAKAGFTRAVNEADYANTDNYTVEILNNTGTPHTPPFQYGERENSYDLPNGSYTMKAYYGTESVASRDEFYVVGETPFVVNGEGKTENTSPLQINVDCYPTCGKVVTFFDNASMDEYFSDYYVEYETEALGEDKAMWAKNDVEPWYLKLNPEGEVVKATIHVTRKDDGKTDVISKTYAMTPGKAWTMNIAPKDGSGSLTLTITIDETTEDHELDFTVPSDWI